VATYRGEFPAAWDHFDQAIPLTDSLHDPFWVVNTLHPSVIARGHAALVLHVLGDDEGAAALVSDNLRIAEQLAHPLGLAYCHYWAAWVEVLRRDAAAARPHVEEAIALSTKMGFALPLPLSRVVRGWALAELGEPEAGLAEIHEALAAQGGMRFKVGLDFNLALLAQACSRAGRVEEALDAVDEALAEEEATGALLWQAELLRLRGELLWALSPERMEEAESNLRRAIEVATEQGAASLRTRAEASLRQLFGSQ
jgi:tetratricopeptide (TPR) repeat protein